MRWCLSLILLTVLPVASVAQSLPPVPVPPENPITPAKVVLGKILFWEEQLSSDDTVSCGTCHRPESGGIDLRDALHPGADNLFFTADDVQGSFGMLRSDENNLYYMDDQFGLFRQVTGRRAPDFTGGIYHSEVFWDGRASSTFVDPESGAIAIQNGGALESQAVGPILSEAEMAHDGRTWDEVNSKLQVSKPLALATNLPADIQAALASAPTYPQLFQNAFGSTDINAVRIAFAIASYERTLVPDQTPFDAFQQGNQQAMTQNQIQGMNDFNAFNQGRCNQCHVPPLFSDGTFRNLGLRPVDEDIGRQAVTGNLADRGRFKVPSLRNVALRGRYFHNGQANDLEDAVEFYDNSGGPFLDNKDPILLGINFPPQVRNRMADFLTALTDPRAEQGLPPFDRPTLRSETVEPGSNRFGDSTVGSGGFAPGTLAITPAHVNAVDFKTGVAGGLGGALSLFAISTGKAPDGFEVNGVPYYVDFNQLIVPPLPIVLAGSAPLEGHTTLKFHIPNDPSLAGFSFTTQWFIADPEAVGGFAASQGAEFQIL